MRVVDTNVVVRILVDDDPAQAERAQQVFEQGDTLLLNSVVLEFEWALRSLYRLPRARIASILRGLVGLPGVRLENATLVARALAWFEAGLDFAEAMHLAATPADGDLITFDRALARRAARLSPNAQTSSLGHQPCLTQLPGSAVSKSPVSGLKLGSGGISPASIRRTISPVGMPWAQNAPIEMAAGPR